MKFVLAFSTGKDSILALHRMVQKGHKPIGLIVMYNRVEERSWFHGADKKLLASISKSLGIPLECYDTDGMDYDVVMEKALSEWKKRGAEACVYGDIDIPGHKMWNEERCRKADLIPIMPLWNENREALVREVIGAGYKCLIKCVHPEKLPAGFLGKIIDEKLLDDMEPYGIDLCGENGEYHTIVVDGPLFNTPVPYQLGEILELEHVTVIELKITETNKQNKPSAFRSNVIEIKYADMDNLPSWMNLVEIVRWNFPGLETQELLDGYRETLIKNINRKSAICALDGKMVVGVLLFSTKYNMICCMAVHPEYRRRGIATRMVKEMMKNLDSTCDVIVDTFREDDPKGKAPRSFYKKLGFEEGTLLSIQTDTDGPWYPVQRFVLKAGSNV